VMDREGNEAAYWNYGEWREDPDGVMGAISAAAMCANFNRPRVEQGDQGG